MHVSTGMMFWFISMIHAEAGHKHALFLMRPLNGFPVFQCSNIQK